MSKEKQSGIFFLLRSFLATIFFFVTKENFANEFFLSLIGHTPFT